MKKPVPKSSGPSTGVMIAIGAVLVLVVGIAGGVLGWLVTTRDSGSSGTSAVKLPDFVYGPTVPKGTAEAYQFAVANQDILKYIPCYCGCGELDGHKSNLDCFIKEANGDDIVFDKHAAG